MKSVYSFIVDACTAVGAVANQYLTAETGGTDGTSNGPDIAPASDADDMLSKIVNLLQASKPVAAKVEPAPRSTAPRPNGRTSVVYAMVPSFDAKLAKAQTGQVKMVLGAIGKAGRKGLSNAEITAALGIKEKSVQSAAWHLRKAGLIRSLSAETGKPLE